MGGSPRVLVIHPLFENIVRIMNAEVTVEPGRMSAPVHGIYDESENNESTVPGVHRGL